MLCQTVRSFIVNVQNLENYFNHTNQGISNLLVEFSLIAVCVVLYVAYKPMILLIILPVQNLEITAMCIIIKFKGESKYVV